MLAWQLLALFVAALAGCSSAYNYKCLPAEGPSVPVKQVMYTVVKARLPGCGTSRRYCRSLAVLYTDKARPDSDAYLAVPQLNLCETDKSRIVEALGDRSKLKMRMTKVDKFCRDLTLDKISGWYRRGYLFRPLVECLSNVCQRWEALAPWQQDQRTHCNEYLNE